VYAKQLIGIPSSRNVNKNVQLSRALEMLTKMYSCRRANESQTTLPTARNN